MSEAVQLPTANGVAERAQDRRRVERISGFGQARDLAERRLAECGVILPVPQTAEWLRAVGYADSTIFVSVGGDGRPAAVLGMGVGGSRALPGHRIYRLQRVAASAAATTDASLLEAVVAGARRDPFCIRVHVEVCERDEVRRLRLGEVLRGLGFVKAPTAVNYEQTLAMDLAASETELFSGCTSSARRNVRLPEKRGFRLVPLTDPAYASKLTSLMNEVFERTGGATRILPWPTILELSRHSPERSRLIGLFPPNEDGPDGLVAFAWGCTNGTYVTYEAGAATRNHGLGNTPLSYAPLWDLITWAKRTGASWFDFGGIPLTVGAEKPEQLSGIGDFKRFFCDQVVRVGEDWILEPRPFRARIARVLRSATLHARSLLESYREGAHGASTRLVSDDASLPT